MCVTDQYKRANHLNISLPAIVPTTNCKLKKLRLERVDDWLLLEKEFIVNQAQTAANHRNDDSNNHRKKSSRSKPAINNRLNLDSFMTNLMNRGLDSTDYIEQKQRDDYDRIEQLSGNPIIVGTLEEFIDDDHCIVQPSDSLAFYYVRILSFVNRKLLKLKCTVLLHSKMYHIVGVLSDHDDNPHINAMKLQTAPKISYADIGGLDAQIEEIRECVELPLTNPELFEEIGIESPCGVILYGPPGTGKSLLAQAVANATKATFLHLCGTELVNSTSGSGPKIVKQLFDTARSLQPAIIFIDEVDAIGAKRYHAKSSGERAIQRTMMELLQQLQGFDARGNVKVIMATNKIQDLDSALIRAGRIDRKIECPLPDFDAKRKIFEIHTSRMKLEGESEVIFKSVMQGNDDLSGADIKAICTEAGLRALRAKRTTVCAEDFEIGKTMVIQQKKNAEVEGMFL